MSPIDAIRQTGRTTRMLRHAVNLARAGKAVYVIADNARDMHRLANEIHQFLPKRLPDGAIFNHGIKFETPDTLGAFDWKKLTVPGAHPNCVFLVDHHAIEDRFRAVLEMLHAYDKP
jgi:hypothetical protein